MRLISSLSLLHLTMAYGLVTDPRLVTHNAALFVLGESMKLVRNISWLEIWGRSLILTLIITQPAATGLDIPTGASAFAAAILAYQAISDLFGCAMEGLDAYWAAQAPVRLSFFFLVTGWSYLRQRDATASGQGLSNRLVFAWGFLEMITWFWVGCFDTRNTNL
jgi:hypothetical protein